jgi:hypothetical protein
LSEYALRRQQAKTTFLNAFVGLELDHRMPRNDNATRIMVGKDNNIASDNCWLGGMRRLLQYSGLRAADVALCTDDKGLSCAQYAAAADAVMQLGLLRLLLQSAAEDMGQNSLLLLQQHKQQLQLTCKCVRHAAAFQFVEDILGQSEGPGQGSSSHPAAQLHARPMTTKQLLMLRAAGALKPQTSQKTERAAAASHEVLETEEIDQLPRPPPHESAADPREDMVKFRQIVPSHDCTSSYPRYCGASFVFSFCAAAVSRCCSE